MKGPKQEQDTSKIITIHLSLITSSISLARHNESSVKKKSTRHPRTQHWIIRKEAECHRGVQMFLLFSEHCPNKISVIAFMRHQKFLFPKSSISKFLLCTRTLVWCHYKNNLTKLNFEGSSGLFCLEFEILKDRDKSRKMRITFAIKIGDKSPRTGRDYSFCRPAVSPVQ